MKNKQLIAGLIALIIGAGCQSSGNHTSQSSMAPPPPREPTITVELIPNPQLTPTSREGDKSKVVYSSNIVAVYVNSNGVSTGTKNMPTTGATSTGTPGR